MPLKKGSSKKTIGRKGKEKPRGKRRALSAVSSEAGKPLPGAGPRLVWSADDVQVSRKRRPVIRIYKF